MRVRARERECERGSASESERVQVDMIGGIDRGIESNDKRK